MSQEFAGRYQVLPNGVTARSAASVDLEHLHVSLNSYLAALGLTPTDRAKMGIAPRQEFDALAELSRRRLARDMEQQEARKALASKLETP